MVDSLTGRSQKWLAFLLVMVLGHALGMSPGLAQNTPVPEHRRYGAWESCPIGSGGQLIETVFCPSDPQRLYVLSDVGGLWRSSDSGQRWHMLHGHLPAKAMSYSPRSLLVDPADANRLVLATGDKWDGQGGVFISTDGGEHWEMTLQAPFEGDSTTHHLGDVMAMEPNDDRTRPLAGRRILVASVDGTLRLSSDAGKTWQPIADSPKVAANDLKFDRSDAKRVWLCARPWKKQTDAKKTLPGGFFISTDGGNTWTKKLDESPSEIVQSGWDPQTLFGIFPKEQQVKRSTDRGETWHPFSQGLAAYPGKWDSHKDGVYNALAAGPDFVLVAGSGGNIYRLNANEQTWTKVPAQTIDEGNWWGRLKPNAFRHFGANLTFITVSPFDPQRWAFTDWYALYFSPDAGKTWRLSIDGIEMTVVNTLAQDIQNPQRLHVGVADVGYFQSTQSGWGLDRIENGIPNNIKCLSSSLVKPGLVYATGPVTYEWMANQIFISDDGGNHWRRSPMKGLPNMKDARCNTIIADPKEGSTVWTTISGALAPNQGGLYVSRDAGQTWSQLPGMPKADRFFRSQYFMGNRELALTNQGAIGAISIGVKRMLSRPTADGPWLEFTLPGGAVPNSIVADLSQPSRLLVALGDSGLWRSDDGGANWQQIHRSSIWDVAVDMHHPGRIAAVSTDQIVYSQDGGDTWLSLNDQLPNRQKRNVVGFAGDYIVVGTGGNGVFRLAVSSIQGTPSSQGTSAKLAGKPLPR